MDAVFPPTNKTFAMTQSHWFRIEDGQIIEHWANRDDLGTAGQLGWIPPTPPTCSRWHGPSVAPSVFDPRRSPCAVAARSAAAPAPSHGPGGPASRVKGPVGPQASTCMGTAQTRMSRLSPHVDWDQGTDTFLRH